MVSSPFSRINCFANHSHAWERDFVIITYEYCSGINRKSAQSFSEDLPVESSRQRTARVFHIFCSALVNTHRSNRVDCSSRGVLNMCLTKCWVVNMNGYWCWPRDASSPCSFSTLSRRPTWAGELGNTLQLGKEYFDWHDHAGKDSNVLKLDTPCML